MITDKELKEYSSLCTTLRNLHDKFVRRRLELRRLLEETAVRQREAFLVLARGNRLTRHLTGLQRQTSGIRYFLHDIENRIKQGNPVLPKNVPEDGETLPEIRMDYQNLHELKRAGLAVIALIEAVKKKLLQLDLLEQRCRELLISIKKAVEAFCHESRIIQRNIYPFGIFSRIRRFLRRLFGKTYFISKDMEDIAALGSITGLVLKIADLPAI